MYCRSKKNWSLGEVEVCLHMSQGCESLDEDRTEQTTILLREHVFHIAVSLTYILHTKLQLPAFAFVLRFQTSELYNRMASSSVALELS